jgi:hypothetical protein
MTKEKVVIDNVMSTNRTVPMVKFCHFLLPDCSPCEKTYRVLFQFLSIVSRGSWSANHKKRSENHNIQNMRKSNSDIPQRDAGVWF